MSTTAAVTLAILGAGPRGVGILERIAENLPEFGGGPIDIHLVDPHPPGGGRIWRDAQSGLLKLNSMAEDVTMYTDESSTIEGPVTPGPSLIEWAEGVRTGAIADVRIADASRRIGLNRDRPLLLGNPRAQWTQMMERRRPVYTEVATARVATDGLTADEVTAQVLAVLEELEGAGELSGGERR